MDTDDHVNKPTASDMGASTDDHVNEPMASNMGASTSPTNTTSSIEADDDQDTLVGERSTTLR